MMPHLEVEDAGELLELAFEGVLVPQSGVQADSGPIIHVLEDILYCFT